MIVDSFNPQSAIHNQQFYLCCLGFDGVSCPISAWRVIDRPRQCQRAASYQLSAASQAVRRYAASFRSPYPQLEAGSWKLEAFFQLNILQTVVLRSTTVRALFEKEMVKPHG